MIEDEILPLFFIVALSALLTVSSGVNVIDAMAGDAFRRYVFVAFVGMTAVAGGFFMFAVQRKFGFIMVKAAGLPCLYAVALAAFRSQTFPVRVILVMAVVAYRGCFTEFIALLMAAGAC